MTISKEMLEKIALLRPIDDVLFAQLVVDIRTCQEMLQKVMKDSNLVVLTVIPQNVVRNIWGRSVILDALCRLGDGTTCYRYDCSSWNRSWRYSYSISIKRSCCYVWIR